MASKNKTKAIAKRRQAKAQKRVRIKKAGTKRPYEDPAPVPPMMIPGKNIPAFLQGLENGYPADHPGRILEDSHKLSAAIIDYAEPLLALADAVSDDGEGGDEEVEIKARKEALELAILLWNIGLLPKHPFTEIRNELMEKARNKPMEETEPGSFGSVFLDKSAEFIGDLLDRMYRRKQEYFAEDKRLVLDYFFQEGDEMSGEGFRLIVVGILSPNEADDGVRGRAPSPDLSGA